MYTTHCSLHSNKKGHNPGRLSCLYCIQHEVGPDWGAIQRKGIFIPLTPCHMSARLMGLLTSVVAILQTQIRVACVMPVSLGIRIQPTLQISSPSRSQSQSPSRTSLFLPQNIPILPPSIVSPLSPAPGPGLPRPTQTHLLQVQVRQC